MSVPEPKTILHSIPAALVTDTLLASISMIPSTEQEENLDPAKTVGFLEIFIVLDAVAGSPQGEEAAAVTLITTLPFEISVAVGVYV